MTKLRTAILVLALAAGLVGLLASDAVTVGIGLRTAGARRPPRRNPTSSRSNGRSRATIGATGGRSAAPPPIAASRSSLYLRPKIGFCNCDTGVADEAELDRVGDLELFSPKFFGLTHGDDIKVGWMRGLSRIYQVDIPYDKPRPIMAMAFNQNCDVMVATVVAPLDHCPSAERHVLAFLNGEPILKWARAQFGI